jgi:hypothetical protein
MAFKEKGRQDASPIPNIVVNHDNPEFKTPPSDLQARRLCRLYALSYETAATLAPLVFAVAPR